MSSSGLTNREVAKRLTQYGLNEISAEKVSPLKRFIKRLVSPIALMLLVAALLSLLIDKIFDFYFILALMVLNFLIGFWQENKADTAIQKLKESISIKAKVFRNNSWQWVDSKYIVPGDILELMVGDIVPADMKILEATNLSVNESVLTGESLPKEKAINDIAYSGSFLTTGRAKAEVVSTGKNTYFGKTVMLIEKSQRRSLLEKDILVISRFLMILSLIAVVILTLFFVVEKLPLGELVILDLSLVIAGIPIALPTVMTLIISLGALELAKKHVVVRRLSALEDLANVNLLLTDKTGTLTKNQISVEKIISYSPYQNNDVILFASFSALQDERSPINRAIVQSFQKQKLEKHFEIVEFTPADSERKRASTVAKINGKAVLVSIGAPQVIEQLCQFDDKTKEQFEKDVQEAARLGY